MALDIYCPEFEDGDTIPTEYTTAGDNHNPPLEFIDIPEDTVTLALIVENLDPDEDKTLHWSLWNIPPHVKGVQPEEIPDEAVEGYNDFGTIGYTGPDAKFSGKRYNFKIFALDTDLDLDEDVSHKNLEKAISGHIIDEANIIGIYS